MINLKTEDELVKLIGKKSPKLVFFKHSTSCPISHRAYEEFKKYADQHPEIETVYLDLLAHRNVSNRLAAESNIKHESPQVIYYKNGEPVWNTSHGRITLESLNQNIT